MVQQKQKEIKNILRTKARTLSLTKTLLILINKKCISLSHVKYFFLCKTLTIRKTIANTVYINTLFSFYQVFSEKCG